MSAFSHHIERFVHGEAEFVIQPMPPGTAREMIGFRVGPQHANGANLDHMTKTFPWEEWQLPFIAGN